MAEKTVGERLAVQEQWSKDHETRCEERQTAIGREIRDVKQAVGGLQKGAWGLAMALLAWCAVQVYAGVKAGETAQAATLDRPPAHAAR